MAQSHDEKRDERLDEALADFFQRLDAGEAIDREAFLSAHEDLREQLSELLDAADWVEELAGPRLSELTGKIPNPSESSGQDSSQAASKLPGEADLSFDDSFDDNAATLQYNHRQKAVSLSDPGRVIRVNDLNKDNPSDSENIIARVTPDNTQTVLPCRFGDYVLEKILGRGGMGVVYRAHQMNLDRTVAIKMIRSGALAGEEEIERFYAEARSAARLDHPHIVSVYQCGEIDGHHFFSMDYIAGTDLAKRILEGPIKSRDAARYVRDVASTIAYAHARGVLHRDLKPANVLIDEQDEVVITDFGLAKLMDSDQGLTRSGAALGTPGYMSPEQAAGNGAQQGAATDVYAMGAILFATLTGKPPFQASTAVQTIMDVIHKPAPQVREINPQLPIDLDTIVAKCLHKDPKSRYASAQELADELDRFLNHAPIKARPVSWFVKSSRWLMHVPIIAALIGYPSASPTPLHRWVQRGILGFIVVLAFTLIFWPRLTRWWTNSTLPMSISIAAGRSDGAYYLAAEQLAASFRERTGLSPNVQQTAGSKDNLRRLINGDCELAILQGSVLGDSRIVVIAPLYYEAIHLLVRESIRAESITDLQNMSVAIGVPDSGTHQAVAILRREMPEIFESMNLVESDWNRFIEDKKLAAAFAVVRLSHPEILRLMDIEKLSLLPLPNVQQISLVEPTFRPYQITPKEYASIPGTVMTLATPAFLASKSDSSQRLATTILRAIYESNAPIERLIPVETAAHWQGLPLHPAAREYFQTILESKTP